MNNNEYEREQLRELLPAYAMKLTDAEESALVESLLRKYPEEAQDLESYDDLADSLLHSAPAIQPPAHLHARLMAAIAEPVTVSTPSHTRAPVVTVAPSAEKAIVRPAFDRRWWGVIAAVLILLIAMNGYMLSEISNLREDQRALEAREQSQTALLTLLARGETTNFELIDARDEDQQAGDPWLARILCSANGNVGILKAENLPGIAPDQVYQLWLFKDGQRISGGLMQPNPDGSATLIFYAPEAMRNYSYAGITAEPATGSAAPTSDPLVRGPLYSVDA